jgi:imidazolonepropionase-like amidohydrolase
MKVWGALLLLLLTGAFGLAQNKAANPDCSVTVIRAGVLIDGKSDSPRKDQVIVIRGNRIESVSNASSAKIPAGATVIDLTGETVLPGLIDSHTHIFLQGEDPAAGRVRRQHPEATGVSLRAARATVAARRALGAGLHHHCATWRPKARATATSESKKPSNERIHIPGPRMYCGHAGHLKHRRLQRSRATRLSSTMPKGAQIVDGPVEARKGGARATRSRR